MKTTAQRITQRMQQTGRQRGKNSIYTVVMDHKAVICHTEATLDTWWAELAPEDKARLYELHLDGILGPEVDPRPVSVTACGLSPRARNSAEFLASLAEVAKAGKIMLQAQQAVNATAGQQQTRGVRNA